jgi:hypothetical protein
MNHKLGVIEYVQRLGVRSGDSREGWIELLGRLRGHEVELDRQRGRHRLEVLDRLRMIGCGWIP